MEDTIRVIAVCKWMNGWFEVLYLFMNQKEMMHPACFVCIWMWINAYPVDDSKFMSHIQPFLISDMEGNRVDG